MIQMYIEIVNDLIDKQQYINYVQNDFSGGYWTGLMSTLRSDWNINVEAYVINYFMMYQLIKLTACV